MHSYISRSIYDQFIKYLGIFPSVALVGPRQAGKSTFLKHALPDYHYVTFDDYQTSLFLEEDPVGFLRTYNENVIFDEVQKAPLLFNGLKKVIDDNRHHMGRFILTGSTHFTMYKSITESLAGRLGVLSLYPFSWEEIPEGLREQSVFKGAYPEVVCRHYKMSEAWYSSYIEQYVFKDLRDMGNIGHLRDFKRFLVLLASRIGSTLNLSDIAKDLGVTSVTLKKWLSHLEAAFVVYLLPPYFENFGKRTIKSPKVYFYDTGIVSFLTGVETEKQYHNGPMAGAIFENFVVMEVVKKMNNMGARGELSFLRTSNKAEIDLVVRTPQETHMIEIKKSATFTRSMVKTLQTFLSASPTAKGFVIYNGEPVHTSDKIAALTLEGYLKTIAQLFE